MRRKALENYEVSIEATVNCTVFNKKHNDHFLINGFQF